MIEENPFSDTFSPVDESIDISGPYHDARLLMSTASARIFRISKAGKTMLLKTPLDSSGRALELLKREYRLGAGLSHQNVASIYTWEADTPAGPGILMEYVDGRTLAEFLKENPSPGARRRVWEQILHAVNYIHKHGVTHNDLKPGNILVSRANDDVKIIDFGLADTDGETLQRQLGGTAGYASPELSARSNDADMRSDIFSLGVIMQDIFGHRYRRIWRKCQNEEPRKRYRNTDALIKAWHRRQQLPKLLWIPVAALCLAAAAALGTLKISSLGSDVDRYSRSSREMADTISALRLSQNHAYDSISALRLGQSLANDSISRLNLRLGQISREKALADSLENAYKESCLRIIEKYKKRISRLRCRQESYAVYKPFNEEMDRNDSLFRRQNPLHWKGIYDKYGISMRLQGSEGLNALANKLPGLEDLTEDVDEQIRLMPLVLEGRPWALRSDSAR